MQQAAKQVAAAQETEIEAMKQEAQAELDAKAKELAYQKQQMASIMAKKEE